jgi:hypothetical protein
MHISMHDVTVQLHNNVLLTKRDKPDLYLDYSFFPESKYVLCARVSGCMLRGARCYSLRSALYFILCRATHIRTHTKHRDDEFKTEICKESVVYLWKEVSLIRRSVPTKVMLNLTPIHAPTHVCYARVLHFHKITDMNGGACVHVRDI